MRCTVSVVSSKTIRKSYVKEQAYNPCILPFSLCVLSEGSKGSFLNFSKMVDNLGSRSGDFLMSLDDTRRNGFLVKSLYNLLLKFSDGFHKNIHRLKLYRRFLFTLKHPFHKSLMFLLHIEKIPYEVPDFFNTFFRELEEHFVNFRYFHCLHDTMIICGCFFVNSKNRRISGCIIEIAG